MLLAESPAIYIFCWRDQKVSQQGRKPLYSTALDDNPVGHQLLANGLERSGSRYCCSSSNAHCSGSTGRHRPWSRYSSSHHGSAATNGFLPTKFINLFIYTFHPSTYQLANLFKLLRPYFIFFK